MWFAVCLFAIPLTAFTTGAPAAPRAPWVTQAAGRHLTTGVVTLDDNGRPYIRREIRDLKANWPDQWSLYLLGLQRFQQVDQNDPLSFFRIAGIHGKPYAVWQDAQGIPNPGGQMNSYCPHGNRLFLTWHRPYLALYEQELYKHVRAVAEEVGNQAVAEQERWETASDSFRIPYWDWALGQAGGDLPDFFITPEIQVTGPDGVERTISNPLYQFRFHPVDQQGFDGKWAHINTTLRWPSSDEPDAQSQPEKFTSNFLTQRRRFQDDTHKAYMSTASFNMFSEMLETVHGWVHYVIGGNTPYMGHMWPLEYSAFEPLFMLHHANVDRLFALYQAVHPDLYLEPANVHDKGNFWIPKNAQVNSSWGLLPFWKDSKTFWTSDDIRETTVYGYAYPETQYWNYASDADWRAAVNATLAEKYSSSTRARLVTGYAASGSSYTDWSINAKAASRDLPPTFQVNFTLVGDFSSDVTLVGAWMRLMPSDNQKEPRSARRANHNEKRQSTSEPTLKGTVGLTSTLLDQIDASKLKSLDETDVVPFLKDRLTWKVYAGDGSRIPDKDLESLDVQVVSARVRVPSDPKQLLEYSQPTSHPEITEGKRIGSHAKV